jgi:hypothetical protein
MLSASCYFRGNYMTPAAASKLLMGVCAVPELVPDCWNAFEPIDIRFKPENLQDVVAALAPSPLTGIRSLAFFLREAWPGFLMSVDLRLGPVQWTTAHNSISFKFDDEWIGGEHALARYLPQSVLPNFPDYASVPDWSQDSERYAELRRTYTPKEFGDLFAKKKPITAPFGPYGCLADVQWFNYFGRVYVEAIGKARLMGAGWQRVEEIGDGLACYATADIDDAHSRRRRSSISKAIEEFVWTPGCKPEQKRIPDFDFTEQLAALPADVAKNPNQPSASSHLHFAGLSANEQEEVLRLLEPDGRKSRGE